MRLFRHPDLQPDLHTSSYLSYEERKGRQGRKTGKEEGKGKKVRKKGKEERKGREERTRGQKERERRKERKILEKKIGKIDGKGR